MTECHACMFACTQGKSPAQGKLLQALVSNDVPLEARPDTRAALDQARAFVHMHTYMYVHIFMCMRRGRGERDRRGRQAAPACTPGQ